jgi:hypothetical protein
MSFQLQEIKIYVLARRQWLTPVILPCNGEDEIRRILVPG